jgi:Uma2 family endonuclease
MGMAAPVYYTADMVRAMPEDGNRYEVVHGELLVTPAPRPWHQVVLDRLRFELSLYLRDHVVGYLVSSPADISWGPDILVQPDLFVVPMDEIRTLDWTKMKNLLLTVEVLSPSSKRADRFTKRRLYQEVGIPLYWIVDADEKLVEQWTPTIQFPVVHRDGVIWSSAGAEPPFGLDLATLFRPL